MRNSLKLANFLKFGLTIAISVLMLVSIVWAGSLTPTSSPAASGYTLADIYTRLTTNAAAGSHSFSPAASPAGSLYTLTQIYNVIPTIDAAKVLSGTTYLGIAGTYDATNLTVGNVKSGVSFGNGLTGSYSASYTWTKFGTGSWVGVNENLDWAAEIGPSGWASQTYSYCGAIPCTNDGSLQGSASYDGPPGGWNGSNSYLSFNNSALQNYEVITTNSTNLGDCTADAGDLVFPDGSVWDKTNAKPYGIKLTGCDSNDSNAAAIWAAAGGSGSQYAYARNAPSAVSIADAWDAKKNLTTGANGTHSYDNDGKNDDYYDRPAISWYADTGDGAGASRLPMIEEYEQGRQGTSASSDSLLYGSNSWSYYYDWSAEQDPYSSGNARTVSAGDGSAGNDGVTYKDNPLWLVVAQ